MDVELYADPSCPWCWSATLWLERVASERQLRLTHQPFSLALRDGTANLPPTLARVREAALGALRVAAAIGDGPTRWAYYVAVARAAFAGFAAGQPPVLDIPAAVAEAGLDSDLAARAHDTGLDAAITAAMGEVGTLLPASDGAVERIPVLVLRGPDGERRALHGPLLDPAPSDDAALALWDAVTTVAAVPGFFEISRPRGHGHSLVAPPGAR
jgi:hypothetical protein